jgi:LmbE family N-acetylglucosaminyl deacetylase
MTTRSRTLPTIPTIAAFVLGAVVLAVVLTVAARPRPMTGTAPLALTALGRRVLVIATHPDDELLTAGGTVTDLLAEGARVRIVVATAGDAYFRAARPLGRGMPGPAQYRALGELRHAESLAAAKVLGLEADDVVSLGYPDGGTSSMWDGSWAAAQAFCGRSGDRTVPYSWAYRPGSPASGQDMAADLAAIVREFKPDTVIAPDPRETHPDHAAVAAFSMYALDDAGFTGTRLTAIVHFKRFPSPWAYLPEAGLAPPPQLLATGVQWLALPVTPHAEQSKHAAFEAYRSQTAIVDLSWYMRSFVRRNELFCLRPPSAPASAATDTRPAAGDAGTVSVTPRPVIAPLTLNPSRVRALRLVRGPHTLWLGIVCQGPVAATTEYRATLRLVGGSASPQRLDVRVHQGAAETVRVGDDSVVLADLTTEADGDTVWVSMPASVLDGHTSAIAGASSLARGLGASHCPWVDVRL